MEDNRVFPLLKIFALVFIQLVAVISVNSRQKIHRVVEITFIIEYATIEFFTISPQYVNIVLTVPYKIKKTNKVRNLKR